MKQAKFKQIDPATKKEIGTEQTFFFDKVLKAKKIYDILPSTK